jgi:hypothetical protein
MLQPPAAICDGIAWRAAGCLKHQSCEKIAQESPKSRACRSDHAEDLTMLKIYLLALLYSVFIGLTAAHDESVKAAAMRHERK